MTTTHPLIPFLSPAKANAFSTLAFWHGWGMRSGVWQSLANGMQGEHLMLLESLPGYNDTAHPSPYTAEAVVDMLMEKHVLPVTLCAWSLGAMLALLAAHRHPEKVQRLILISPTPSFIQREGWKYGVDASLLAEFSKAIETDAEDALRRFVAMFNYKDIHAKENARQLSDFSIPPLDVLTGGLNILRDLDLRDAVKTIQQPTLLIHGAKDPLMPLAAAQWLQDAMPHATLRIAEQAAHAPFVSDPAQCANWITEWMQTSTETLQNPV